MSLREDKPFDVNYAVIFMVVGYCLINLSLLESGLRQALAFGSLGISVALSTKEILFDIIKRGKVKSYMLGSFIILFCYLIYALLGAYGEYGHSKYLYLLFVAFIGFFSFPPMLKYNSSQKTFGELLFYTSLLFCFFAIFFANPEEGRRSEMGLNPAILARLCMISGIYISTVIYFKGLSTIRILILLFSITAVFFTATKTPVPVYIFSFYFVTLQKINLKKIFKICFYVVIIGLVGFLILKFVIPERYTDRILDPKGLSVESQSTDGNRLDLYETALKIIPNNPEGLGYGGFAKYSFIVVPHNLFLELAVEGGIMLSALFLIWAILVIIRIKKMKLDNIPLTFISILYVYFFISFLFGGELTIQALLFYILGTFILFYSPDKRNKRLNLSFSNKHKFKSL